MLRSKLDILQELDLLSLLEVQSDVTRLIEEKVKLLQVEKQHGFLGQLETGDGTKNKGSQEKQNLVSATCNDSDEDDFLLTQFDQIAREKLLSRNDDVTDVKGANEFEMLNKKPDLSSPLKGTQSLPDSLGSLENDLQIFPPKIKDGIGSGIHGKNVLQSSNCRIRDLSPRKRQNTKKICLDENAPLTPLVSLNSNPVTRKPWILEDFKLNEDLISVKRGRKRLSSMKLNKFYRQGGRPPEVEGFQEAVAGPEDSSSCEFENLRHRSKSPPGFGRLDFPTTQERVDDKKKSQEIIHGKTKHRFLAATCRVIPKQERQYLFKSDYLNQLVDDGDFVWDDKSLRIFCRK